MSRLKLLMVPVLALVSLVSLSGCVAYPAYGGGGYYGGPSAAVIVPAPLYRPYYGGGYYGGGWGRGHWR